MRIDPGDKSNDDFDANSWGLSDLPDDILDLISDVQELETQIDEQLDDLEIGYDND